MKTRNFVFTAVLLSCLTSFAGPGQIGSSNDVQANKKTTMGLNVCVGMGRLKMQTCGGYSTDDDGNRIHEFSVENEYGKHLMKSTDEFPGVDQKAYGKGLENMSKYGADMPIIGFMMGRLKTAMKKVVEDPSAENIEFLEVQKIRLAQLIAASVQ